MLTVVDYSIFHGPVYEKYWKCKKKKKCIERMKMRNLARLVDSKNSGLPVAYAHVLRTSLRSRVIVWRWREWERIVTRYSHHQQPRDSCLFYSLYSWETKSVVISRSWNATAAVDSPTRRRRPSLVVRILGISLPRKLLLAIHYSSHLSLSN